MRGHRVTHAAALRIAVIGAGTISQAIHIPSIRRAGLDLTWVCDLSPGRAQKLASQLGVKGATDPLTVLQADDVDAVLIATPGSHAMIAAAALRHGKHILVEKPVALTVREVDELIALARRHDLVAQVGYMKMHDPLTQTARDQLKTLSDIRLVRVTVAHPADAPQLSHLRLSPVPPDVDPVVIAAAEREEGERASEALPGAPHDILNYYSRVLAGSVIHESSLLRALGLPLPTAWTATAFPELDGPSPASLIAEASVGAVRYLLNWNWLPEYPEYEEELKVFAGDGRLEFHLAKPYVLEARSYLRIETSAGLQRRDTRFLDSYETGFLTVGRLRALGP